VDKLTDWELEEMRKLKDRLVFAIMATPRGISGQLVAETIKEALFDYWR
jgi:hypothetical protein